MSVSDTSLYGRIYAVGAQFRYATCKYGRIIGQQYTRGIGIITAMSTTKPFHSAGSFSTLFRGRAMSKLLLNGGPADVKMRAHFGWSWDLLTKTVEYEIKSSIVLIEKYNLINKFIYFISKK